MIAGLTHDCGRIRAASWFPGVRYRSCVAAVLAINLAAVIASPAYARAPSERLKAVGDEADVVGVIVAYAAGGRMAGAAPDESPHARAARLSAVLSRRLPTALSFERSMRNGAEVLRFDTPRTREQAASVVDAIATLPGVRYVVPNRVVRPQVVPSDAQYTQQWGFQYVPGTVEGANFEAAWNVTQGAAAQTVGIIDSGVARGHEELAGQLRVQPAFPNGGYDFYSDGNSSGDGDGRDNDPQEAPTACGHGTHVAGTIAADTVFPAQSGNPVGVAGGAPASRILMARALNSIGNDADAIDAMHWMAGESVGTVGINQQVPVAVNMSFGSGGACGAGYQEAVDALLAAGVLPVAAAGNDNGDVALAAPANCRGVVAVAAADVAGNRAYFSNFGSGVTITAPGVNVLSTGGTNTGSCVKSGTSMAAPHVTAASSLLRATVPTLTPQQMVLGLRAGARAFPASSDCLSVGCGAGLLDAGQSVSAVTGTQTRIGWGEPGATVLESDGAVSFTVSRIGAAAQAVTANVSTVNGNALSGIDFGAPSPAQLNWAANDTTDRLVTIPIIHRAGEQGTRGFSIALSSTSPLVNVVAPSGVAVTINEVDCNVVVPIQVGDVVTGQFDPTHPENYCHGGVRGPAFNTVRYSFQGTAGQVVSIDLASTAAAPAVLDTYLYLLAPDKSIVAENDDIVATRNRSSQILQFQLTQSGTHYIDATTWSATQDATGSYSLHLYQCGTYQSLGTCSVDVDGDGIADASDALMLLRRLVGIDGAKLTADRSFRTCATRTNASSVAAFVDAQKSPVAGTIPLDVDGDGEVRATTDGVMILRALLGLPAAAITNGAVNPAGIRGTASAVAQHLTQQCGIAVTP